MIVESKTGLGEETVFEFKHIPDLSKTTKMEGALSKNTNQRAVERRNLRAFLVGCLVILVLVGFGLRLAMKVFWTMCASPW